MGMCKAPSGAIHTIAIREEIFWQLQVVDVNHIPLVLHAIALNVAHVAGRYSTANSKCSICENQAEHSLGLCTQQKEDCINTRGRSQYLFTARRGKVSILVFVLNLMEQLLCILRLK